MAKRRTRYRVNKYVGSTAGRIYVSDDAGRVLVETNGVTMVGRPRKKREVFNDVKNVGTFKQGFNKISLWSDSNPEWTNLTAHGGLHPVTFRLYEHDQRQLIRTLAVAFGYKVYRKGTGGWLIYVPKNNRH